MDNIAQQKHAINVGGQKVTFERIVQGLANEDLNHDKLQDMREQLLQKVEQYSSIIAETLYDNPQLQLQALKRLQQAKAVLDYGWEDSKAMNNAEFDLLLVHVGIFKEQEAQEWESKVRYIVPLLVFFYASLLVGVIVFTGRWYPELHLNQPLPVIGIPLPILVWAGIGSLTAILYRFYTQQRGRSSAEIRWLMARPVIGIIMGAVAYLAIVAGLFIFGASAGQASFTAEDARPQLLWLIAFLGGFSDRFFEMVIDQVVGKFGSAERREAERVERSLQATFDELTTNAPVAAGSATAADDAAIND